MVLIVFINYIVGYWRKYIFLCSRTICLLFCGRHHGGEAVVGCRDADWARGNTAVTSSWLLLVERVAGAFVANQFALVLGRTMQSEGGR